MSKISEISELKVLRSNRAMVYVAFFAVVWLTPNTYYVYYSFCNFKEPYNEIASAGASLIVASFIMLFTSRKNIKVAGIFSMAEITISGYYYILTIMSSDKFSAWALIPAFVFTLILPLAVYYSTEEIDKPVNYGKVDEVILNEFMDKNPQSRPLDYLRDKNKL
jgi:hypothetical protein